MSKKPSQRKKGVQKASSNLIAKKSTVPDLVKIQAWCDQANRFENQGEIRRALACLDKAQCALPDHSEIMADRMRYLALLDEFKEAERLLKKITPNNPQWVHAINALAVSYDRQGERERAIELFDQALSLLPEHAEVWNNKALCHLHGNQLPEALSCALKSVELDSKRAVFCVNAAQILGTMFRWHEARIFVIKALALEPENPEFWLQSYACCSWERDYVYARSSLEQVVKYTPAEKRLKEWQGLMFQLDLLMASWDQFDEQCQSIHASIQAGEVPLRPLTLLALPLGLEDQHKMLTTYRNAKQFAVFSPFVPPVYASDRIKVAYISSDLGPHPVMYLCRSLLTRYDRTHFEVFVYATRSFPDDENFRYVQSHTEHFVDITTFTAEQSVKQIRHDAPMIVVDLNGHTDAARQDLLAQRLAPIQINYIGFPGTMGSTFHDYILADTTVVPNEAAQLYSEKIVWLPGSFQINVDTRIKPQSMLRSEAGIPDEVSVLASFNNTMKINPVLFACWMRVMQQVPNSILWLIANTDDVKGRLRDYAQAHGVSGARIYFAPHVGYQKHLSRLALADLVLDTIPFGGGASTSDALWCGVPVLTCLGDTFAGRMSASLLGAAGLSELVTASLSIYEQKAVTLLREPEQLRELRERLRSVEVRSRIFDTATKIRSIESGYSYMAQRYRQGLPADSFTVLEDDTTVEGFVGVQNQK